MNADPSPTYDPALALLADAMELIAAARDEYAEALRYQEVDARVEEALREVVADDAMIACIRQNGIGPVTSAEVTR